MAFTITPPLGVGHHKLIQALEKTPTKNWNTLAKPSEVLKVVFSRCEKSKNTLCLEDPLVRKVVVWVTSDGSIPKEKGLLLISTIYAKEISKVILDDVKGLELLDINTGADLIEAAILSGEITLVTKKLLPWYTAQRPVEKRFLLAAFERGNAEFVEQLLTMQPQWLKPYIFPMDMAIKHGCDELVLKNIDGNNEFLYAKDSHALCPIHYAAEECNLKLVDALLYRYFIQNRYHCPNFLFPAEYSNYQFLLDRYLVLCDKILGIPHPSKYEDIENNYLTFLKMHLNITVGAHKGKYPALFTSLSAISLQPVIVRLLIIIQNFCNERLKYYQAVPDDREFQIKFSRYTQTLHDIQLWIECYEHSLENYHLVIKDVKTLKAAFSEYRAIARPLARL